MLFLRQTVQLPCLFRADGKGLFAQNVLALLQACLLYTSTTADGREYGLQHLANIWHGTKLGFNADDPYFASIIGKTITQITFYAADGVYVLPVSVAL